MNRNWQLLVFVTLITPASRCLTAEQPPDEQRSVKVQSERVVIPISVAEASARAHLLQETIHGALQILHRDFFDEDDAHAIPSASLEDVFHELATSCGVKVKWLNVQTDVLNADHQPVDDFERAAVQEIAKGTQRFERTEEGQFRFAGRIRLASQCLKCHLKNRTTTDDRSAGLLIAIPIRDTRNVLRSPTESQPENLR